MKDWRILYPFESQFLETPDGQRYHYLDEGPREAPVILMVHGNPTWSFYWRNLVLALRKDYRIIVPDHIGCGLSARPTRSEYSFTMDQRIRDLSFLIETLDLRGITLLAHDWGGAIGMGTAGRLPERFSRFALFNTGAFRFKRIPLRIAVCRLPGFGRLAIQGFNLFARAAVSMAVEKPLSETVKAGLLAPYDTWRNRLATCEFVHDIPMSPRDRSWKTLCETETNLAQFREFPVCLMWGMRDWCFTPAFMRRFQEFFPNAEVHPFQEAGHYLAEEKWEEMVPILKRFMEK
ncbi:MAG: alpha/beta fold hydrolase [Thermoguttaceae bacterium]|nr:alpha/beta fold hydrolase [Thermoguttaceae bacterium]MDO4424179.1 alpha/beta fold hydrolase [Planctomycetia bacterium]